MSAYKALGQNLSQNCLLVERHGEAKQSMRQIEEELNPL
jgi:hypothetical protein